MIAEPIVDPPCNAPDIQTRMPTVPAMAQNQTSICGLRRIAPSPKIKFGFTCKPRNPNTEASRSLSSFAQSPNGEAWQVAQAQTASSGQELVRLFERERMDSSSSSLTPDIVAALTSAPQNRLGQGSDGASTLGASHELFLPERQRRIHLGGAQS